MVTEQDVRHVAQLARLGVDEARLPSLVEELNRILGHMDVLSKVPGDGAETDADAGMPLRDDSGPPTPMSLPLDRIAPAMTEGFFIVPRLATHDTDGEGA